jgi:hypothetical protein
MSNETPQQKHPKFYKDPHLWIDAIELEREIGIVTTKLTLDFLSETIKNDDLWKYKPLFKPQEGEQFIKDLESAVSAATDIEDAKFTWLTYWLVYKNNHQMVSVSLEDISDTCGNTSFSASRYVDTLRKLGYYL